MRSTYAQSKHRVEELVLGLGKESADVIARYERKLSVLETEKSKLMETVAALNDTKVTDMFIC